jgi:predicted RNA-binding protein YlqC (UPF0109 family)
MENSTAEMSSATGQQRSIWTAPSTCGKIVTREGEVLRALFNLAKTAERRRRRAWHVSVSNFTKMNRSDVTDSYLSLDENRLTDDYAAMLTQPYQLYVERTDKARNMARFYA